MHAAKNLNDLDDLQFGNFVKDGEVPIGGRTTIGGSSTKYLCSYNARNNSNTTNASSTVVMGNKQAVLTRFLNLGIDAPKQNGRLLVWGNFSIWATSNKISQQNINMWCYLPTNVTHQNLDSGNKKSWSVVYHRRMKQFELQQAYEKTRVDLFSSTIVPFKFLLELGPCRSTGTHHLKCSLLVTDANSCTSSPTTAEEFKRTLTENGTVVLPCSDSRVIRIESPFFSCAATQFEYQSSRQTSLIPDFVFQYQQVQFEMGNKILSEPMWLATPHDVKMAVIDLNKNTNADNVSVYLKDVTVMDSVFVDTAFERPVISSLGSDLEQSAMSFRSPVTFQPLANHGFVAAYEGSWYAVRLATKPYAPAFSKWQGSVELMLPSGSSLPDLTIYLTNVLPTSNSASTLPKEVFACRFDAKDESCLAIDSIKSGDLWSHTQIGARSANPYGDDAMIWHQEAATANDVLRTDIPFYFNTDTLPDSFPSVPANGCTVAFWIGFTSGFVPQGLMIAEFTGSGNDCVRVLTHPVLPETVIFEVRIGGLFDRMFETSTSVLSRQRWSHCVFTMAGNGEISGYVNGVDVGGILTGTNRLLQHIAVETNQKHLRSMSLWFTDGARTIVPSSSFGQEDLRSRTDFVLQGILSHWYEVWDVNTGEDVQISVTVSAGGCHVSADTAVERPVSNAAVGFDVLASGEEATTVSRVIAVTNDVITVFLGVKPIVAGGICNYTLSVSSGVLRATHDRKTLDVQKGEVLSRVLIRGRALTNSVRGPLTASLSATSELGDTAICATLPTSMNGASHPKGCPGAVYVSGSPSSTYCSGQSGKYPWWSKCCDWSIASGSCVPKTMPGYCVNRGLYCVSSLNDCSTRPRVECTITDGSTSNQPGVDCRCGSNDCNDLTGRYCVASTNSCTLR